MEIKPILAAHYSISFRTPGFSKDWGRWKLEDKIKKPDYQHNPDKQLPNGQPDIASVYMPVIGPYDSCDPDLCEYHILLAKAVGIDAFIVNWFGHTASGVSEKDDQQIKMLLTLAEQLDFKIALCFNDACCFAPWQNDVTDRKQALACLENIFNYACENYFNSSAYLKIDERPVITTLNVGKPGSAWDWPFFTATEWAGIRQTLSKEIVLVQNYQPQMGGIDFTQWDSVYPWVSIYFSDYDTDENFWEQSHSALGKGQFQFVSGLVNPGFDDRGSGGSGDRGPRVFSRRQGEKYSATWEDNLRNEAAFIQIGTWNHYPQGTGIEPVKEIILQKTAAVPGWGYRELITTREYAVRFLQKKLWPLPALFLPERLYRLRKSGAPAMRGDRIRLYLLEGDITGSTLGLEHAGV